MIKFKNEEKRMEVLRSILLEGWCEEYDYCEVFFKETEKLTLNIKKVVFNKNTTIGEVKDFFNNNEGFFINICFYC